MIKKYIVRSILILIYFTLAKPIFAQVAISYPTPAQDVSANYFSSALKVRIDISQASTSGCNISINLPSGITYDFGSLLQFSSNNAATINYSGGTSSNPIFSISPANLPLGTFVIFQINRKADCIAKNNAIAGTIFKDQVTATSSAGSYSDTAPNINSYIVNYPAFSIGQPAAVTNAVVGQTYIRTFTLTNGGNGCAEDVYFSIDYPANGISQILLQCNLIPIPPTSIVGTTRYYKISGGSLNVSQEFCNNDVLNFTETFKVLKCNGQTNYSAGWGPTSAPSTWCQTDVGVGTVNMASGSPNFTDMQITNLNYVNACTPWDVRMRFYNVASGNAAAGAMYNVKPTMGFDFYSSQVVYWPTVLYGPNETIDAVNFRIGNTAVPLNLINGGQTFQYDTSLFTADPDGIGVGLEDLDGDGQFDDLASGKYLDLIFLYSFNCPSTAGACTLGTTDVVVLHGPVGSLYYNEMCGDYITPPARRSLAVNNYFYQTPSAPNFINPPQIIGGVPFTINLNTFFGAVNFPYNPSARNIWVLTMPPGVSVSGTGNATTNGSNPFPFTQSGQVLTFNYGDTSYRDLFINLVYTCGTSTTLNFNATLTRFADTTVNCKCFGKYLCEDFTIAATCPGPCAAGPSPDKPIVRRVDESLGYTDYTMTTRQNAAALTTNQLQLAMYLQTIQITGRAVQNNYATNLHVELELDKASNGDNKLVPVSAVVTVKRNGAIIRTTNFVASDFITTASTLTKTNIDLNLTSCFPGNVIFGNEDITVVAKYKVSTKVLAPTPTLPAGAVWRFYNLVSGGAKSFCYDWKPQFYFLGTYETHDNFYYYGFSPGCTTSKPQILERNCYSGGTNLFPNEYIPGRNFMEFTITIPTGFEFDSLRLGNGARGYGEPSVFLTPFSQTATTVTFKNDGSWFPIPITQEIYYAEVWIEPYFRPTCNVTNPVNIPNGGEYIKVKSYDYYYSNNVPIGTIPTDNSLQSNHTYYHGPAVPYPVSSQVSIALTNQSGIIQATKATENFRIRIEATGANAAPYNWIAIPTTASINVLQIVDLATNLPVSSLSYPLGNIYYLSTAALAPGTFRDYRIDFKYSSCNTSSFQIFGGWNCNSYPTDPDLSTCSKEFLTLSFTQVNAEVQVIQTPTPPPSLAFCSPKGYAFEINNVQASNVVDSSFRLTMPIGFSPVGGTFLAEYPRGAANWEAVSPTIVGNVYTYDLSNIAAYPAQGVPGTLNSLSADDRYINVKFDTTTDCNYVPGSKFLFSTEANKPCGIAATGSNIDTQSN